MVEVKADDTKAIVAVVNADTKRLALLEECERLQLAAERGKSTTEDEERIKEVSISFARQPCWSNSSYIRCTSTCMHSYIDFLCMYMSMYMHWHVGTCTDTSVHALTRRLLHGYLPDRCTKS